MPVFFYIDPSILDDPGMAGARSIVLSYTFFRTGDMEVLNLADEVRKQQGGGGPGAPDDGTREKIRQWAENVAARTGVALPDSAPTQAPASGVIALTGAGASVPGSRSTSSGTAPAAPVVSPPLH